MCLAFELDLASVHEDIFFFYGNGFFYLVSMSNDVYYELNSFGNAFVFVSFYVCVCVGGGGKGWLAFKPTYTHGRLFNISNEF